MIFLTGITLVKSLRVLMAEQFHWAGNLSRKGFRRKAGLDSCGLTEICGRGRVLSALVKSRHGLTGLDYNRGSRVFLVRCNPLD